MRRSPMPPTVTITLGTAEISVEFRGDRVDLPGRAAFLGLKSDDTPGCALVPFRQHYEGSTVFLPFAIHRLYAARIDANGHVEAWRREWTNAQWTPPLLDDVGFRAYRSDGILRFIFIHQHPQEDHWRSLVESLSSQSQNPRLLGWTKDLSANDGWGSVLPIGFPLRASTHGDHALAPLEAVQTAGALVPAYRLQPRGSASPRVRIYQLLPRLFTNTNERRKVNGSLAENGVGKFADITDTALAKLRDELAITHLWLTGVLSHISSTPHPEIGQKADDPALCKGRAGSPYAIRNYGDVCPDFAVDPAHRLEEFKALLQRIQRAGLRTLIDFVPNHVARNHHSALVEFGRLDDRTLFFSPRNNFFWLQADSPGGGPPLRLPAATENTASSGHTIFDLEQRAGRVTGNNAVTWSPSRDDWFETVKLNYGYDFTTGTRGYPCAGNTSAAIPDTWKKMDAVLAYWQGFGIDGFRCDMAHMVPPEFWQWSVARARARQPDVLFIAEAYNNDPMKVQSGDPLVRGFHSVSVELLNAGFDAVYDDPAYKALKRVYDGPGWANDLDEAIGVRDGTIQPDYVFQRALRYAENHDEVRLASRRNWAGIGMEVGRPVCAILFALSRGPVLLYSGQEVGEPADGAEGFGGDDGRTTIFDYWSMPELTKWLSDHRFDGARLSPAQHALRAYYGRLLRLLDEPAFRDGGFIPLNPVNTQNPDFGRIPGEPASGHWLYACIRHDPCSGQAFLILANLHPSRSFANVQIRLPAEAIDAFRSSNPVQSILLTDHLHNSDAAMITERNEVSVTEIHPLTAAYYSGSPAINPR